MKNALTHQHALHQGSIKWRGLAAAVKAGGLNLPAAMQVKQAIVGGTADLQAATIQPQQSGGRIGQLGQQGGQRQSMLVMQAKAER